MKEKYKISVVVPVYNAGAYLERCINSVICQTYKNWELILVDDGSTDESGKICDFYMQNDSRIKAIHQVNQGVSVARNEGIDHASADILIFVDADDWLETNALETINAYWEKHLQLLLFDYYDVKNIENKKRKKFFFVDKLEFDEASIIQNNLVNLIIPGQAFKYKTRDPMIQGVWGKAFSCSYIKSESIRFPNGVFMNEDCVFNICAVRNITKARYISRPLYNYFINETSVTFQQDKVSERLIENYKNCCQYVKHVDQTLEDDHQIKMAEKYVLWTMKIILWRTALEKDYKKKKLGRNYCMHFLKEISIEDQTLGNLLFLLLLRHKMFEVMEKMICLRKIFSHERKED